MQNALGIEVLELTLGVIMFFERKIFVFVVDIPKLLRGIIGV
jgi:hypothetical protein